VYLDVPQPRQLDQSQRGNPPLVHWASVSPRGAIDIRTSQNVIAYWAALPTWVQPWLLREAHAALAPEHDDNTGPRRFRRLPAGDYGVMLEVDWGDSILEENEVAEEMLRMAGQGHRAPTLQGTVAWLGTIDPRNGLHASVDVFRLPMLTARAAQRVMRRAYPPTTRPRHVDLAS
jgi:hypothetical protein